MQSEWLGIPIDGWLAIVTTCLATATFLLYLQTRTTAQQAARTAEVAERNLKVQSTPAVLGRVIPSATKHAPPAKNSYTIQFTNVSDRVALGLWTVMHFADEPLTNEAPAAPRPDWTPFVEGFPITALMPGESKSAVEQWEWQGTGPATFRDVLLEISYTDTAGTRYQADVVNWVDHLPTDSVSVTLEGIEETPIPTRTKRSLLRALVSRRRRTQHSP